MTHLEGIEARLIALELLFRGMLTGLALSTPEPVAEVDRMAAEFRSTVGYIKFGTTDKHADMLALVIAMVDKNFEAIRSRVLHNIEIKAAQAGKN